MIRQICIALLALGAAGAASADVGVSLNFIQPGLFGSVGIGALPVVVAPPVVYAPPPVLVQPAPYYVQPQPVYYNSGYYATPYYYGRAYGHGHGRGHGHGHHEDD